MSVSELVRVYQSARAERLSLEKVADAQKKVETAHKDALIEALRDLKDARQSGVVVNDQIVQLRVKSVPQVADWPTLYAHVQATGEFDLLYKRLNGSAVNLRWEDGKSVPGTQPFPLEELSIRKAS
jgi:hypothetical protein